MIKFKMITHTINFQSLVGLLIVTMGALFISCSDNTGLSDKDPNTLVESKLIINEFIPRNKLIDNPTPSLLDEGGNYSDWVELYNTGPNPIQLSDYYLTDSRVDLYTFTLRDTVLGAGEYYVVFASGKTMNIDTLSLVPLIVDTTAVYQNHAPFKLSFTCGDELFLIQKSDSMVVDSVIFDKDDLSIYPDLISNESYGRIIDGDPNSPFGPMTSDVSGERATPGAPNVASDRSKSDPRLTPDRYDPVACADPTTI